MISLVTLILSTVSLVLYALQHHLMTNEVNRFRHFVGTMKEEVHRVNEVVKEENRKRLEEEERLRKMKEIERKKKVSLFLSAV